VGSDEEALMAATTTAQTDQAAIVATALDYLEGWFDGDAERMKRALHPELAKRSSEVRRTMTKERMVELTASGGGRVEDPGGDRGIEVDVVDVHGSIATAVVRSPVYREYLHLVKTEDGWKIVNVLWQHT
jgi:Putative lumazine-binding